VFSFFFLLTLFLLHSDVLIGRNGEMKLCDFGSATTQVMRPQNGREVCVCEEEIQRFTTLLYRSPEMIDLYSGHAVDEQADVWALGVLLYKLAFLFMPFADEKLAILNVNYSVPADSSYSKALRDTIDQLLQADPNARPDIYELTKCVYEQRLGQRCPIAEFSHRRGLRRVAPSDQDDHGSSSAAAAAASRRERQHQQQPQSPFAAVDKNRQGECPRYAYSDRRRHRRRRNNDFSGDDGNDDMAPSNTQQLFAVLEQQQLQGNYAAASRQYTTDSDSDDDFNPRAMDPKPAALTSASSPAFLTPFSASSSSSSPFMTPSTPSPPMQPANQGNFFATATPPPQLQRPTPFSTTPQQPNFFASPTPFDVAISTVPVPTSPVFFAQQQQQMQPATPFSQPFLFPAHQQQQQRQQEQHGHRRTASVNVTFASAQPSSPIQTQPSHRRSGSTATTADFFAQ
jgi:serine/threonine protein kinase